MGIESYWQDYTSFEKEMFAKACRKLLKHTFIVREKDDENKKMYYFIAKKQEPFSEYFGFIGFDIVVDRENGVIMLRNLGDLIKSNHITLKKVESIILCCLWTLYTDKIHSLKKYITISVSDLRFELEKYNVNDKIDKTTLSNALNLLSKFNLLDVNGKIGDIDCTIYLYPSLQFALDLDEFKNFAKQSKDKMKQIDNIGDDDENK